MPKSQTLTLSADDGHQLAAYRADPDGGARGRLVVIQEIFGVNRHIRGVCDRFAASGYTALAPALFDRRAAARPKAPLARPIRPMRVAFRQPARPTA